MRLRDSSELTMMRLNYVRVLMLVSMGAATLAGCSCSGGGSSADTTPAAASSSGEQPAVEPRARTCSWQVSRLDLRAPHGPTLSTTEAVAVELTADALRAHSDGPIAVEASVRPDEFVLDAPIAIEGIGTLPTSVGLSGLSMGRDGVAMTVEVSVGLDGVDSRGRQNPNRFLVSVSGLECPSLRARGDVHAVGEARALEDGTLRVADGPVSLAPAPEGSPLVVLRPRGDAPLTVWETQRRGEWVRVGFRWSSELGAGELRGWVEAPALRTPSEGEAQSVERALAALPLRVGILGAGGGGSDLGGLLSGVRDCAGSYDGESKPARIRTGTPVLASPGGERWGRIQEEDGYVVGDGERDGYLPVISASGLRGLVRCPRFGDRGGSPAPAAWVESASVQWAP